MKRLWVRPAQQGAGLGGQLAEAVIEVARTRRYTAMYLDTMPQSMQAAYRLYCSMGFTAVDRYNQNPVLLRQDSLEIAFLRRDL
jgi:GNAT superfamily N-acetyltransferase